MEALFCFSFIWLEAKSLMQTQKETSTQTKQET